MWERLDSSSRKTGFTLFSFISSISSQFDSLLQPHRHLATEEEKEYALYQGDLWLRQHRHHAPYILPYLPDGSKYQRNMTIPQSLTSENRLVDLEAEIRREFEGTQSNPLVDTWKLQE
eukprot:TRINITY_DN375_c0_g1_i8.p1 TRINITY_DN375_c0_g1~~TRINITY_DN375_c0_g1_i8.p1  ORF type:complete len:118 (+),score=23.05 TRINITY_DN375_c0_g1_i8:190-543(+)